MTDEALREQINELRRDLVDGEDLSTALSLVAAALQRRVRRVQRSTRLLIALAEGNQAISEEAQQLAERISETLDRFQDDLQRDHEHMEQVITAYQDELEATIERVDAIEGGL